MAKKTVRKSPETEMDPIVGQKVPNFSFESTTGQTSLKEFGTQNLILFFYPKDMTSGCTLEAHDFERLQKNFKKIKVSVIGVSPDSMKSHEKFCEKEALSVTLISDETKEICEWFGVWKEKSMYGRRYMGVERSTFLIDAKGVVKQAWRKVKVPGHAEAVLEYVESEK